MFMYTYALDTVSYACFPIQIYRYTWFTVIPLISLMLHVIACTGMPGPRHLIMYTYACYARHLALLYVLTGLHLTTLDSHVQILEPRPWWPYCSWSERAADPLVVVRVQQKLGNRRSSSFQLFFWLALEVPLAAREHLSAFIYLFIWCTFTFSGDVIFL